MRGVSYGGYHFGNNGWALITPPGFRDQQISGVYLGGGATPPIFAGVQRSPRILSFVLVPLPGEWGSYETRYRNLERDCLRSDLGIERALVVEFDSGQQTTIQARLRSRRDPWEIVFEAASEYLSSDGVDVSETGPTVAGNDVTIEVTTSGTARTRPVIYAEYVKDKTSGNFYALPISIEETAGYDLTGYPFSFTIDHAALVTATKSLSDGSDILVTVNGVEVARDVENANNASTRITFPLTVDALDTASVEILYAPAGQTYGLGSTYKAVAAYVVENQISSTLTSLPYRITFDHDAVVTASRSNADGDDIRVFVDGVEVDRAVLDPNTTTTDVWFPLDLGGDAAKLVELRMGSSDFSGTTFTHGSLTLSLSSNTERYFQTPGFNNSVATNIPAYIRTKNVQVRTDFPLTTRYIAQTDTSDASQPSLRSEIPSFAATTGGGNYFEFYEGGLRITNVKTTIEWRTENNLTRVRIADSPDRSTWTSRHEFGTASTSKTTTAYATYALSGSATAVILGLDRNNASFPGGTEEQEAEFSGTGASELGYTINSADVPTATAYTDPTDTAGSEAYSVTVDATITDELSHTLTIRGLRVLQGQQVKVDAARKRIVLLDSSDAEIDGSAASARTKLIISSTDHDWLALEPHATTTLTWAEDNLDSDGLTLVVEWDDQWR